MLVEIYVPKHAVRLTYRSDTRRARPPCFPTLPGGLDGILSKSEHLHLTFRVYRTVYRAALCAKNITQYSGDNTALSAVLGIQECSLPRITARFQVGYKRLADCTSPLEIRFDW